ncbi:PocR ligand-binding domain-containing protein [Natranaerobius trueperi]|uniref:histidine kinase n=1 Tax=Natranaerobius trueperi TaxID=759412 RepID=A0A226BWX8_9FIRM|nr:PocR ligand-binding domain-containing protein [Natranaerobius trueperi]OWZ83523.1 hypothetical protein CDO51_07905 [Natranaerobius trueperi]
MKYNFTDLVSLDELRSTLEKLYSLIELPMSIEDVNQNPLINIGFSDICKKYHTQNPKTLCRCKRSGAFVTDYLYENDYITYRCQNGLIDMASPIIIEGEHVATFLIGQIFFQKPDRDYFKKQAIKFGFNVDEYLQALDRIPVYSKEDAYKIMDYCTNFAQILTKLGLNNLKEIKHKNKLEENEKKYDLLINGISDITLLCKIEKVNDLRIAKVNKNFLKKINLTESEVVGSLLKEIINNNLYTKLNDKINTAIKERKKMQFEIFNLNNYYDIKLMPLECDEYIKHLIITASNISHKKEMEEYRLQLEKLESVGFLAGGIAHDFNNLLTVSMANISLAKKYISEENEYNNTKVLNLLNETNSSFNQAKNLTQQLLTFSKGGLLL